MVTRHFNVKCTKCPTLYTVERIKLTKEDRVSMGKNQTYFPTGPTSRSYDIKVVSNQTGLVAHDCIPAFGGQE